MAVIGGLYVRQGLEYLSVRNQATEQRAIVQRLSRENAALTREQQSLGEPSTIMRQARTLGMVRPGERPYVITGLPGR